MKIDKNLLIVTVLVLLVIISVVQAVQLVSVKGKLADFGTGTRVISSSSGSGTTSSSSGSGGVPTNIQNLPGMVGGC